MKVYTLSIFLVALLELSSAWLDCPDGQRSKEFNKVVYDPYPRTTSWEECVSEASYNDPNVAIDGTRHDENTAQFSGSSNTQGIQCPPGTIKRTYQRPAQHYTDVPETYEQCDSESPMSTNQNPAVSPTGERWNDYNNPTGTSDNQGLQCPPGTVKRTHQRPVHHHAEIPQMYEQCDSEGLINTNQDPARSPTGERWTEYNNPSGTSNNQGLQCPPGTVKRTYQRAVLHYSETPQTYEQCDQEGSISTNQDPVVSPSGQSWNDWNSQTGSVASTDSEVSCPEGYIKVRVQLPVNHPEEIPQVVHRCHSSYSDKNGPSRAPNGDPWDVYNG